MKGILNRLLRVEKLNGLNRADPDATTYLRRWTLLRLLGYRVYLHHILTSDWSRDEHDHPSGFLSFIFWGGYTEWHRGVVTGSFKAPRFIVRSADWRHRLETTGAWSLVFMGRKARSWGFWMDDVWVPWNEYVYGPGRGRRVAS